MINKRMSTKTKRCLMDLASARQLILDLGLLAKAKLSPHSRGGVVAASLKNRCMGLNDETGTKLGSESQDSVPSTLLMRPALHLIFLDMPGSAKRVRVCAAEIAQVNRACPGARSRVLIQYILYIRIPRCRILQTSLHWGYPPRFQVRVFVFLEKRKFEF
jgi:hypothetical protein